VLVREYSNKTWQKGTPQRGIVGILGGMCGEGRERVVMEDRQRYVSPRSEGWPHSIVGLASFFSSRKKKHERSRTNADWESPLQHNTLINRVFQLLED